MIIRIDKDMLLVELYELRSFITDTNVQTEETVKARISQLKSGDSNPNWKGGISKDHARYLAIQRERYPEHKKARDAVYAALKKGILIKPERWIAKRLEEKREVMFDNVPQARIYKIWNVFCLGLVLSPRTIVEFQIQLKCRRLLCSFL